MNRWTIAAITLAILIGTIHGTLAAIWDLTVDQDWQSA